MLGRSNNLLLFHSGSSFLCLTDFIYTLWKDFRGFAEFFMQMIPPKVTDYRKLCIMDDQPEPTENLVSSATSHGEKVNWDDIFWVGKTEILNLK